jgi:hypothetical protein
LSWDDSGDNLDLRDYKMQKIINIIASGDLLVYCPDNLEEKHHDIGIIYSVEDIFLSADIETKIKKIKKFKIFWNRSCLYDEYSQKTMTRKLTQTINRKKIMFLVKQNEA